LGQPSHPPVRSLGWLTVCRLADHSLPASSRSSYTLISATKSMPAGTPLRVQQTSQTALNGTDFNSSCKARRLEESPSLSYPWSLSTGWSSAHDNGYSVPGELHVQLDRRDPQPRSLPKRAESVFGRQAACPAMSNDDGADWITGVECRPWASDSEARRVLRLTFGLQKWQARGLPLATVSAAIESAGSCLTQMSTKNDWAERSIRSRLMAGSTPM
jgi:hypothetical protein